MRRADYEVIVAIATFGGARAGRGQSERRSRLERQAIGAIGKGNDAVEVVIAVRTAAEHAQREVDLGARGFSQQGHAENISLVMTGPVPVIHVLPHGYKDVDARDKRGHDD